MIKSTNRYSNSIVIKHALVAELVYALASETSLETGMGSSPIQCTNYLICGRSSIG